MATTEYKRMSYDQLLYFTQYLLSKLKTSPLATDHTYAIAISGRTVTLTDNDGAAQTIDIPLPEDASDTTAGLMTAALYTKLMSIEPSAEKNVISKITINGETADPADGTVAITTPTKTSELTNDSHYQTADEVLATVTDASPTVTVTKTDSGATITITDRNGTTTADIANGKNGANGKDGTAGTTPDITASATVDNTSSTTPSVKVTKTGTAEAPVFSFAFSGLNGEKGEKGDKGDKGETGATGATGATGPAYTLTDTDKAAITAAVLAQMTNAETTAM